MTAAAIRYYLHNMDDLRRDIADLQADLEQYKAMLPECWKVNDDQSPYKPHDVKWANIQTVVQTEHTEKLAIRRAEYSLTLEKTLKRLQDILASIEWVIRHFTASEREVYRMRYVEKKERSYIAEKIGIWGESVSRIDKRIVRDIQRHYENMQKK
jgi:DNA-directed RNA polymerase specialized sigma subunit